MWLKAESEHLAEPQGCPDRASSFFGRGWHLLSRAGDIGVTSYSGPRKCSLLTVMGPLHYTHLELEILTYVSLSREGSPPFSPFKSFFKYLIDVVGKTPIVVTVWFS